ncbi:helix-turn-helix domain-containing protein [Reinekea blandensis]|uniref:AraC-type DNA-binding domain-containing protein n=1 Tax=Reinekea blandensis MED297 TaxID=314283 RepID=A4BB05_9GAMM|nr:AraC family transcriptional regulator [Reinekea blandensis]EAR10618.1 AraC-type DNA-binding domain-containing protein [Reinekea sp. MED297] [Reinekea blandensis MED297]
MKNYIREQKIKTLVENYYKLTGIRLPDGLEAENCVDGYCPLVSYLSCWQQMVMLTPNIELPLKLAELSHISDYGVIGQVLQNSRSIGSGLNTVLQFTSLITDAVNLRVQPKGRHFYVNFMFSDFVPVELRPILFFKILADFLVISAQVTNHRFPEKVALTTIEIGDHVGQLEPFLNYFKCPIAVVSGHYSVVVPSDFLALKVYQPSEAIVPNILPLLECQQQKVHSCTVASRVELIFQEAHYPVKVRIDAVAEQLGMSVASLKRKLALEGTCYSELKSNFLLKRTIFLTKTKKRSAQYISRSLGYNDASAFSRAFRSWTCRGYEDYFSD